VTAVPEAAARDLLVALGADPADEDLAGTEQLAPGGPGWWSTPSTCA
jgi:hypothetical protein